MEKGCAQVSLSLFLLVEWMYDCVSEIMFVGKWLGGMVVWEEYDLI